MRMTEARERKVPPAAVAVLAGLLPVLALAFPEAETSTLQPAAVEPQAETPPLGRLEVKGMEQAEKAGELHDPFTLLHEQAAEAPQALPKAKGAEGPKVSGGGALRDSHSAPSAKAGKAETVPGISLQGIAAGAGGRLALLSDGRQTAALAVGESLGAWQVRSVEESRVLVAGPGGERWLQLALQ